MHFRAALRILSALSLAIAASAALGAEDDFLLPDQAFRISGQAAGPESVTVSWDIEEGYYLYRSKFKFRSQSVGIETGSPSTPPAERKQDEFFGEVEIYRDRVDVRLPLKRDAGSSDILTLEATSQGCADEGLCYPPHKQSILLELPRLAASDRPPEDIPVAGSARREQPALDKLTTLNETLGLAHGEDDILPAEEAFKLDARVAGPDRVELRWKIAEGTYLYQEKIDIALEDADGVAVGEFDLPEAELKEDGVRPDGSFGSVAVYHDRIDLDLPLLRTQVTPSEATLVVKYQGCAERGICYPPVTQRLRLDLPAPTAVAKVSAKTASAPETPADAPAQPVSEQDQIAALLAGGSLWAASALFFGFGLLLAFTPCVFPMIPILSGIIAGQGTSLTTRKAFVLSTVYVLAMALTYASVGVLAGLGGANLQAAFQDPWILSAFVLVFVILALSMFGFFELQLPSSLQSKLSELSNRQQGGSLVGVAIMGVLSALIVGPCVAPPLAGALIFIGQSGDALLGFSALFAMGLGMGAPLIAIGTSAGRLLPRAGAWMDSVKAVFGVALLAVAIVLLERIVPPAAAMVLWGVLLICSAMYMGVLRPLTSDESGWAKFWKGLGFVMLVYGILMLVGAAAGGKDTLQPLRGLGIGAGSPQEHAIFRRIKTVDDLNRELTAAAAAGKPTMLDFYADWCVACKEMERYTFSDPEVAAEMSRFVLLQADVTDNDADDQSLMQGLFGIPGPPAILFFDTQGEELRAFRLMGYKPAAEFAEQLRKAAP